MSQREYPHITSAKYRGKPRLCECCDWAATHSIDVQLSWFRGEDEVYLVCEEDAATARLNYPYFLQKLNRRRAYMAERVKAVRDDGAREWCGERRNIPPRYRIIEQ